MAYVNKKQEVPADFFQKCFMKGYLRTLPKKQRIWCMIHENNVSAECCCRHTFSRASRNNKKQLRV